MNTYRDITLLDSLQERWQSVDWGGLTDSERECISADLCVGQTSNGSLHQFLTNCDPQFQLAAVAGLRRIGAPALADVVARAIALFPGGKPPESAKERWEALKPDLEAEPSETDRLTDEFWRVYEREDALRLMELYADAHPSEFRGPRDLMEMWQSRKARGMEQPPEKLVKLQREAESDSKHTSDRCPECGQPMPSYRKTCKRCGRPRGGPAVA